MTCEICFEDKRPTQFEKGFVVCRSCNYQRTKDDKKPSDKYILARINSLTNYYRKQRDLIYFPEPGVVMKGGKPYSK